MTVVVAAVEADRSLPRCLDALAVACQSRRVDVIVVGPDRLSEQVRSGADLQFIPVEHDALAPRMWSEGLANAGAPIVALTTAHCFASPGWCDALLTCFRSDKAVACGGPFRLAAEASTLDAAIFFLRYSAYLENGHRNHVTDIAGDNAAYRVSGIPPDAWHRETGFWEHDVNRAIIEGGEAIAWNEAAVVEFGLSFSFSKICRHRFEHGRLFGLARIARGESRLKIILAFMLVPLVLAVRAGRRVAAAREYRARFIKALPLMLAIGFCWAAGEAAGAARGAHAHRG